MNIPSVIPRFLSAKFPTLLIAITLNVLISSSSFAALILAPVNVTSNVATRSGFSLASLTDQSGLSSNYTSGITDFDSYLGTNPTHNGGDAANDWGTNNNVTAAQLNFDLGGSISIQTLALWNRGGGGQGIRNFTIFASDDSSFSSSTNLGSYTATEVLGTGSATLPEQFVFTPTTARYFRLDIQNGYSSVLLSLGEVTFEQTVPEPSSALLFGLAALGLSARRRRH
jgi:hypothetical protein